MFEIHSVSSDELRRSKRISTHSDLMKPGVEEKKTSTFKLMSLYVLVSAQLTLKIFVGILNRRFRLSKLTIDFNYVRGFSFQLKVIWKSWIVGFLDLFS